MSIKKITVTTILALSLAALSVNAASASNWRAHHPRRAEVNGRLANQNRRINTEYREGDISKSQAHDLHAEDRGIRGEERYDASQDGGHITKAEQHSLNGQENGVSQQIGR